MSCCISKSRQSERDRYSGAVTDTDSITSCAIGIGCVIPWLYRVHPLENECNRVNASDENAKTIRHPFGEVSLALWYQIMGGATHDSRRMSHKRT